MRKLPNCEQAVIPDLKLHGYLLDEENSKGKSAFFYKMSMKFMTKEGQTIAVETLMANQIRAIGKQDVWHVRELREAA